MEQLFQIAAKALIQNEHGQILMVSIPEWSGTPAHWDLPGGRMDPGETFLQTLNRELLEEIGTGYISQPKQIMGMLTNITIPVGDVRYPLVFMIYHTEIPADHRIVLDPTSAEQAYEWFSPVVAAEKMAIKFTPEFCSYVAALG